MLREVIDYLLAVETITLSNTEKSTLLDKAYRNLFLLWPAGQLSRRRHHHRNHRQRPDRRSRPARPGKNGEYPRFNSMIART